eukprot:m.54832 g.54832  ORF g.54832 m.54832 type:complete len:379 (+) comp7729_c1_seq3:31-1167(+)
MPQVFLCLACFSCGSFQVQQETKGKRWTCKICREKQSFRKIFAKGTARECRPVVQKLNMMRGEMEMSSTREVEEYEPRFDEEEEWELEEEGNGDGNRNQSGSKWDLFKTVEEDLDEDAIDEEHDHYVFELPSRKKPKRHATPIKKKKSIHEQVRDWSEGNEDVFIHPVSISDSHSTGCSTPLSVQQTNNTNYTGNVDSDIVDDANTNNANSDSDDSNDEVLAMWKSLRGDSEAEPYLQNKLDVTPKEDAMVEKKEKRTIFVLQTSEKEPNLKLPQPMENDKVIHPRPYHQHHSNPLSDEKCCPEKDKKEPLWSYPQRHQQTSVQKTNRQSHPNNNCNQSLSKWDMFKSNNNNSDDSSNDDDDDINVSSFYTTATTSIN